MSYVEAFLGFLCTACAIAMLVMIGMLFYWGAARGACVQRSSVGPVSWCSAWESDLTPEQKQEWQEWKRNHSGEAL